MSRAFFRRPSLKRVAMSAAAAIGLTLVAYTTAYFVNVRVGGVPDTFSSVIGPLRRGASEPIVIIGERAVRYRWGGASAVRLFALAHGIDRWLRPGVWTETFVFKPLPAEKDSP